MNGVVVRLMSEKRFGFLKGEDNRDYFFHMADFNGFWDDLATDFDANRKIKVTFDITPSEKGPRASNVTRVDGGV